MAADQLEIPEGDIRCEECRGDPAQYRIDFEIDCPNCRNVGHVPDPDFYDACCTFDPHSEWGSTPGFRRTV